MTEAFRLYIASPDADRLERSLTGEAALFVLGGSGHAGRTLADAAVLGPDVMILDSVLSGGDGYHVMENMSRRMAAPPRVLLLERTAGPDCACRPDAVRPYPAHGGMDDLAAWALEAARAPLPALALPWEQARREIADRLLRLLDVPERLKGRAYMCWAVAAGICAPQLARAFSRGLYPLAARAFDTTPQAVERAIRTAVEYTWLHGDLAAIQGMFGLSVDAEKGKPTNAECLTMLMEHGRREMQRALDGEKGST